MANVEPKMIQGWTDSVAAALQVCLPAPAEDLRRLGRREIRPPASCQELSVLIQRNKHSAIAGLRLELERDHPSGASPEITSVPQTRECPEALQINQVARLHS